MLVLLSHNDSSNSLASSEALYAVGEFRDQQQQAYAGFPTYSGSDRAVYGPEHKFSLRVSSKAERNTKTPRISCIYTASAPK